MDNLTHSLVGVLLARTRLGRLSPYAMPALVVGANLPDVDIAVRLWGGPEGYLVHHRGVTHGILGAALLALLLAAALRGLERRRGRAAEGSWPGALAIAGAALASHPLLDYLNVYGLRPWLPFDATWVYGDAVFILDPWLWLFLGTAALLAGPRSRAGDVTWSLLFSAAVGLLLVSAGAGLVARWLAGVWSVAALALMAVRLRGPRRGRGAWPLRAGLTASALYVGALFALGPAAEARARAAMADALGAGGSWSAVTHAPQPLDPFAWEVLFEDSASVWVQPLHLVRGTGERTRLDKRPDDARVQAAAASDCAAAWRSFVRHPHAALATDGEDVLIELMDARYQRVPSSRAEHGPRRSDWSSTLVRITPDGPRCEPAE